MSALHMHRLTDSTAIPAALSTIPQASTPSTLDGTDNKPLNHGITGYSPSGHHNGHVAPTSKSEKTATHNWMRAIHRVSESEKSGEVHIA